MTTSTSISPGALIYDDEGRPTWRYRPEPFQRAFEASGLTARELADRAGIHRDSIKRILALKPYRAYNGRWYTAKTIGYGNATKIALALGLDLVEWEL